MITGKKDVYMFQPHCQTDRERERGPADSVDMKDSILCYENTMILSFMYLNINENIPII